jgi:hypothetical protein
LDDLALVVELACETECRTDADQRALLRVAHKVDTERAKQTTTNPPEIRVAPWLEVLAYNTRALDVGDHHIKAPSEIKDRKKTKWKAAA